LISFLFRFALYRYPFPYIFQAKYVRNKKINENKLVGGTTTWGTIWGPVYEHLCVFQYSTQVLVDRTQHPPLFTPYPLFFLFFFHFHGLEICKIAIICRFLIA
jgi:hypothetical protein